MDEVYVYRSPQDAARSSGPLQGVRIALQPNISVAGWPTDAGSGALVNFTALEDATVAKRLREAGAWLCGSTRMSEFGFGLEGSKAGGALCEGTVDAELVLDIAGESRLAGLRAAVCAFKPSYGLTSRFGIVGLVPSMECCGIISRKPRVMREILQTVAGPDGLDFSLPDEPVPDFTPQAIDPQIVSIGVLRDAASALSAVENQTFQTSVSVLQEMGFHLREVSLLDFSLFSLVHRIVGSVEASSCTGRYDSVRYGRRMPGARNWNDMYLLSRGAAFGPLLKSYLLQGAFFQFERYGAYEDACRIRARLLAEMQQLISQVDFLLVPAVDRILPQGSTSLADTYAQFSLTAFANVTGQPVLYVPPASQQGTHGGFQLAGPRLSDARLLSLGEYILNRRQGG